MDSTRVNGAQIRGGFKERDSMRNRVEIILSHKGNLTAKYGRENLFRIEETLGELKTSMADRGIESHIHWLESDDPKKVRKSVAEREREYLSRPINLLIVGGDDVVPFFRLRNEVEDGDLQIHSDAPYASRRENWTIPDRAVGRIPGVKEVGFLLKALRYAAKKHTREALGNRRGFGYSTSKWKAASKKVYESISPRGRLRLSPPVTKKEFAPKWLAERTFLYFNLHGLEEKSAWYGERAPQDPEEYRAFPVALLPELIPRLSGAVVFSEACYGGHILGKDVESSLALTFLDRNADCFVGSSAIAYGPHKPPSTEADLLCKYFFQYATKGASYGNALMNAKKDFVRKMLRIQGYLDEDDRKTLLEFNLFGDPGLSCRVMEEKDEQVVAKHH
jgi:hypothetical protein